MKTRYRFTFLLSIPLTLTVYGQPDALMSKVLNNLGLDKKQIDWNLSKAKKNPAENDVTIIVLALQTSDNPDWLTYDMYLLTVHSSTGKIITKTFEKDKWESNAVRLESISIDTAPYILAEGVRAFGIRTSYYGSSRPNPFQEETLSLYIRKENELVNVLDNFVTNEFNGDWDMECEGMFKTQESILIMMSQKNNGFNDILIRGKTSIEESKKGQWRMCF